MSYSNLSSHGIFDVDVLPPRHVSRAKKRSKGWKRAMMDGFEKIAIRQFRENLQYIDYYRMYEGKLTFQELSEVVPHLGDLESMLDGVGVESFLKHYDILGTIVDAFIGQYVNFEDKFHVTDNGEVAKNDYLRHMNRQLSQRFEEIIRNEVKIGMAERGFNPDQKRKFNSEEEQQQYLQQMRQAQAESEPKDLKKAKGTPFKTAGVKWGEATMELDKERFNIPRHVKEELKHYLLCGRPFRHFRIGHDDYSIETWDSKGVFTSGEIETDLAQDGEYVGRFHLYTPSEIIGKFGHKIPTNIQAKLLGDKNWKYGGYDGYSNDYTIGLASGSIKEAIENNFNKRVEVPFGGYFDYKFSLAMQEDFGIPMGVQTMLNKDGSTTQTERFLPRIQGDYYNRNSGYARILKDDGYQPRADLCQVTEVYFKAYDKLGYLTYLDEEGFPVTKTVTEEILPGFLKEHGIKQINNQSLVEIVKEFTPGEIKWVYVPVVYYGVKIQSPRLHEPIYIDVEPFEHQIKGDSDFDVKLPVAGFLGKGIAKKIEPYQAKFNLAMNQMHSLMEKELGMFLLMNIDMIPSEYDNWGNSEDALVELRNLAKSVGIMPVAPTLDNSGPKGIVGNMGMQNLSNAPQIQNRIEIANFVRNEAFRVVGIKPAMTEQPTKYTTAEGVKVGQEASYAQVTDVYADFNYHIKNANELHLSVAQYCHANKKDKSLYYTKSDLSLQFLDIHDPQLPLRRLGIIPTESSSKRKQTETFRNYLLNNNTLKTDVLEVAELIYSDDMQVMLDIARKANARRLEEQRQLNEQQSQSQQQLQEMKAQADAEKYQREEMSKEKDRETKIEVATIGAFGRAADKKSDPAAFEAIRRESERSKRDNEMAQHKVDMDLKNFALNEQKVQNAQNIAAQQLKLKGEEIRLRKDKMRSDEMIAVVNKN